nr:MAG TPA: hypothetical protein [Caudoviricetes sp.]
MKKDSNKLKSLKLSLHNSTVTLALFCVLMW